MTPDNNVSDTPKPQFICPNQNDAFTKSDTKKGNGKLGEKVGLITIDEVVAAGGNGGTANPDYYLCKGVNYLSFSPYLMNRYASTYSVSDSGRLGDIVVLGSSQGSAPVINLSPEYISQMTRDGTIGNEYRIE